MWGDSFESRSFEPGSWLFNLAQALRKIYNVSRTYVVSKVSREVSKSGKHQIFIETK